MGAPFAPTQDQAAAGWPGGGLALRLPAPQLSLCLPPVPPCLLPLSPSHFSYTTLSAFWEPSPFFLYLHLSASASLSLLPPLSSPSGFYFSLSFYPMHFSLVSLSNVSPTSLSLPCPPPRFPSYVFVSLCAPRHSLHPPTLQGSPPLHVFLSLTCPPTQDGRAWVPAPNIGWEAGSHHGVFSGMCREGSLSREARIRLMTWSCPLLLWGLGFPIC